MDFSKVMFDVDKESPEHMVSQLMLSQGDTRRSVNMLLRCFGDEIMRWNVNQPTDDTKKHIIEKIITIVDLLLDDSKKDDCMIGDADASQAGDSSVASEEAADGNSMIIAVSPSHAEYIESSRTSTKRRHTQEYFCLFCNAKFSCKLDANPHFGEHLEYKPVLCLLCDNKFHDTDAFTLHHQLNHPEATDLKYEIREDQNIERWVDEFLESQTTSLSHRLTLNCSCAICCPVCEKLRPRKSLVNPAFGLPCHNHNDAFLAEHIHQHLAYNAYECTYCKKLGFSTRMPNLDSTALIHVRENHFVRDANLQLSRAFPKTLTIAKLERFIAESVQKRRLIEKKWRINKIEQIKLEILKNQQFTSLDLHHHPKPLQYPPTNGVANSHRDNSHHHKNNFPPFSFKGNVNHIRAEGGRVINLPSPHPKKIVQRNSFKNSGGLNHTNYNNSNNSNNHVINLSLHNNANSNDTTAAIANTGHGVASTTASVLSKINIINNNNNNNNNNNTIDLTKESFGIDEGIIGISTGVRFYVKCLHCNIELPNRKQLKVHHRQAHPGLNMACFTTPKPIVASEVSP